MKKQTAQIIVKLTGILIGLLSFGLAFIWFDWKLALILFLGLWSNNISNIKN
jgi:hypothetical protein